MDTYNDEPIGAIYDEAEEYQDWEPKDFQRWYYGKKNIDDLDKFFDKILTLDEEQKLSIDD